MADKQQPVAAAYDERLILAAKEGRISLVQKWLRSGADVDAKDEDGWTALHMACWYRHFNVVQFLIDHGAEIDIKNDDGETPLFVMTHSAAPPDLKIVKLLVESGADSNDRDDDTGWTPFFSACAHGHFEMGKYLIDYGDADVNAGGEEGCTLLKIACTMRDGLELEVVSFLLENGADLYAKDEDGNTELVNAIICENIRLFNLLLPYYGAGINAKVLNGFTALHVACMDGSMAMMVESLIENGAKLHLKDTMHGGTPLHYACEYGHLELVKLLVNYGANLHAKNYYDAKPLFEACKCGEVEVGKFLIESGADIQAENNVGDTSLHRACKNGELQTAKMLTHHGADIHAKNHSDETPLHFACRDGRLEVVMFLLSLGANVKAETAEGKIPLHLASERDRPEVVWFLVRHYPWLVSERSN